MSDLRERLQELADVAARHGRTPGPEVARRRAHLRRLRLLGGTAMLVVLAVVAGMVATDRPSDRPTPLTPTPTAGPTSTTIPTNSTVPLPRWIPSVTPLRVRAHPGPYPGPDPGGIVRDVTSLVRGCRDRSQVRLWARAQGKVWLIAAKPPPPGRQHLCWATALMNQGGGGLGTQATSSRSTSGLACSLRPGHRAPRASCRHRRSIGCWPSTRPATRSQPAGCG